MEAQLFFLVLVLVASSQGVPQGYNIQAPGNQRPQAPQAFQGLQGPQGPQGLQGPQRPQGPQGQQVVHPSAPAQYSYQWEVNDPPSNNFYGQQEQRDDANTQGSYYVDLPDGRRLKVDYFVDDSGFHPSVTYEGEIVATPNGGGGAGPQAFPRPSATPSQIYSPTGK